MYALSSGGMNRLEVTEAVAESNDVYGEVAKEFQIIQQELQYFDVDYREALRNRAVETPSSELQDFLTDMLSIIDSGGDLTTFLDDKRKKHAKETRAMQERSLDTLELIGEMYLTISIFPLLIIIMTFLVLLGVLAILNVQFVPVFGNLPETPSAVR